MNAVSGKTQNQEQCLLQTLEQLMEISVVYVISKGISFDFPSSDWKHVSKTSCSCKQIIMTVISTIIVDKHYYVP